MTRITDILAEGRPTLSFEFFPPKTPEGVAKVRDTVAALARHEPDFISVTYGAMGSTRDTTRDLVIDLERTHDFPAMAHLTCVGHTTAEIDDLLDAYQAGGVANILALGGDPPADGSPVTGDFTYASDLVAHIAERDAFSIGVAAHPELHPRSDGDRAADRRHLAAKLEVADFALTQFFFDADDYCRLRDEMADLGCDKPIVPGVMPFISVPGVRRMAAMNGAAVPADLASRLDEVDGDADATRALGVEVARDLVARLRAEGAPGIHLYALNQTASVEAVLAD